jgi:hypothetical protein
MGTIKRRNRTSRADIGPYKRFELVTGWIVYVMLNYYTGYGDGFDTNVGHFVSDEMRADWETNRADLMERWRSGEVAEEPWLMLSADARRRRPWAVRMFDGSGGGGVSAFSGQIPQLQL